MSPRPGTKASPQRNPRLASALALVLCAGVASAQIELPGHDVHAMNRVGYGPSPADAATIAVYGVPAWIEHNLSGSSTVANPRLDDLLAFYPDPGKDGYEDPGNTIEKLAERDLAYALYGELPLREQLVDFWHNHFSTDYQPIRSAFLSFPVAEPTRHASFFLRRDQDFYRENGLGRFEDLLIRSARSVSMLIYLDTIHSASGSPNENYAREVMELHTLGEGQGYDENDVAVAAKLFTCWDVGLDAPDPYALAADEAPIPLTRAELNARGDINEDGGEFGDGVVGTADLMIVFAHYGESCNDISCGDVDGDGVVGESDANVILANWGRYWYVGHVYRDGDYSGGQKSLFGGDLVLGPSATPEERYAEAIAFLRYLANHESTARFVSSKLIAKFVANVGHDPADLDSWPPNLLALLADCEQAWLGSSGDISVVLRTIFTSTVFRKGTALRWDKPGTPLETVLRSMRVFEHADRGVGKITTPAQLALLGAAVEAGGFYELFEERLPTGNGENDEISTGAMLGAIGFFVQSYGTTSAIEHDWGTYLPGIDASSPELPERILDLLYGPNGHTASDRAFAQQYHQELLGQGGTMTLDDMCAGLAPFLASYPQGFLQ